MKYTFLLLLYFSAQQDIMSQVRTVYAEDGETKVNWDYIINQNRINEEEYPFVYGSGCTESPSFANSSSKLAQNGSNTYGASNLIDDDPRTAWVEGKTDYGIGEYFEVNLPHGSYNIAIFNGYQKSYDSWRNNSRVKKFKIYGDNKLICFVVLQDLMGHQNFDLPTDNVYKRYKFEIVEVYPGLKWKDVAISEITSMGCCFSINTKILAGTQFISTEKLTNASTIRSIDFNTNSLVDTKLMHSVKTTHHTLLKVQTDSKMIELTPYHPLYIKNYGVTSLLKLRQSEAYCSYEEMIDEVEVLMWNDDKKETEFKKIKQIELIKGNFETFSIQKLSSGMNYIVNGFVSYVY